MRCDLKKNYNCFETDQPSNMDGFKIFIRNRSDCVSIKKINRPKQNSSMNEI